MAHESVSMDCSFTDVDVMVDASMETDTASAVSQRSRKGPRFGLAYDRVVLSSYSVLGAWPLALGLLLYPNVLSMKPTSRPARLLTGYSLDLPLPFRLQSMQYGWENRVGGSSTGRQADVGAWGKASKEAAHR